MDGIRSKTHTIRDPSVSTWLVRDVGSSNVKSPPLCSFIRYLFIRTLRCLLLSSFWFCLTTDSTYKFSIFLSFSVSFFSVVYTTSKYPRVFIVGKRVLFLVNSILGFFCHLPLTIFDSQRGVLSVQL